MKTREQVIGEYLIQFYPDVETIEGKQAAEQDATAIIENLKYEGFVVLKADELTKDISAALVGATNE